MIQTLFYKWIKYNNNLIALKLIKLINKIAPIMKMINKNMEF